MTHDSSGLREQFHCLCERYARGLPQRIASIESAWSRLLQASCDENTRETLQRLVHALKGSGGTFGFPAITAAASMLEDSLACTTSEGSASSRSQSGEVSRQIGDLRRAAEDASRRVVVAEARSR